MRLDPRLLFGWTRDVALAYAGGLVLGAPFALGAVWVTGRELAATACLVLAMGALLLVLRRTAANHQAATPAHHHRRPLPAPSSSQSRVA